MGTKTGNLALVKEILKAVYKALAGLNYEYCIQSWSIILTKVKLKVTPTFGIYNKLRERAREKEWYSQVLCLQVNVKCFLQNCA